MNSTETNFVIYLRSALEAAECLSEKGFTNQKLSKYDDTLLKRCRDLDTDLHDIYDLVREDDE